MQSSTSTGSEATFSSKIYHLQQENHKLTAELSLTEEKIGKEIADRQQVEGIQKSLEIDLSTARNEINRLRGDNF
jgi:hypothetical protein